MIVPMTADLTSLSAADFREHLGSQFELPDGPFQSELVEVNDLEGSGGLREPFSLIFRGPSDQTLPQGTHRVEHKRLGSLEIFLVPVGPDDDGDGMLYEAVFA
jgi:hypothetical protein